MSKRLTVSLFALAGLAGASSATAVDLVGVYELAERNDPQLQAAYYRKEATGENPRQALANFLPNLSGSGTYTRGGTESFIAGTQISDTDTDTENLRLDLAQTIYNQANYEQMDIARGQVSQAEAEYQVAYQEFLLRVSERYFAVLTAQDSLTFSEAEEKALQRQFEQAEQRFEVGLTAVTDVHEARASYDRARARVIVARNTLADAFEALRELTGQAFTEVEPLQEDLPLESPAPANAEDWVQLAVQNDPRLITRRYAVEIAQQQVQLERTGHYPNLEAFAGYSEFTDNELILRDDNLIPIGTTSFEQDDLAYGIRLNVPIYSGGVISSRTRQARHLVDAAMQDEEAQQRLTVRQVENAYRSVIAGIQEVEAFRQALVSADSALEATQAGFEVGTRTIVDVLLSEQRYFQALRDYSDARHLYILNHLRLQAAAGMLDSDDLVAVNALLD
ncbi:MAG: TolC family outer membrane protein [Xanthomonadales bacterium]|nr:TolC family outer membrane protein [Xanthomonadales bacterium]